jgi:hypothetical protein
MYCFITYKRETKTAFLHFQLLPEKIFYFIFSIDNLTMSNEDRFRLDTSSLQRPRRSKRLNRDVIIFAINYLSYTLVYLSLLTRCFCNSLDTGRWYKIISHDFINLNKYAKITPSIDTGNKDTDVALPQTRKKSRMVQEINLFANNSLNPIGATSTTSKPTTATTSKQTAATTSEPTTPTTSKPIRPIKPTKPITKNVIAKQSSSQKVIFIVLFN